MSPQGPGRGSGRSGRGGSGAGRGGSGRGGAAGRGGSGGGRGGSDSGRSGRSGGSARGQGASPSGGRGRGPGRPGGSKAGGSKSRGDQRPAQQRSAAERGLGGDQVEGRQAVRELLLAGTRKVREVLVVDDREHDEGLRDLIDLAGDLRVAVRPVARTKLASVARTESPQGVVALASPLPEADFDELLVSPSVVGDAPFLLAVDGVTDPGNLGALLRTAECAGVSGVVLPRHRAVHVTPTVTKSAAGAVERLPMTLVGGLPTAITRMQQAGMWVVGLDGGGETSLFDLAFAREPVCLVLGAEDKGLSRLVRERCDAVAAIPMAGSLGSLNVSVAGALALFEVVRRRIL